MVNLAQVADNNSLFQCTVRDCKKIFQSKSNLTRHQKIHAPNKAEISTYCEYPLCGYSSVQRYNVETHFYTHEKKKFHPCPHIAECKFTSEHAVDLVNHYETIHKATDGRLRVEETLAAQPWPDSVASATQSLRTKDPRVRPAPYPAPPADGYSSRSHGKAQAIIKGVPSSSSSSHNLPSFPPFSTNSYDGPISSRRFNIPQTQSQLSLPARLAQDKDQLPKLLLSHGWISPGKLTQRSLTGNESYNMIRRRFTWACHHYYGPGSPYSDYLKTRPIPRKMAPASGVPGQMQMESDFGFDAEGANFLAHLPIDRWFEEWRFSIIENNHEQSEVSPSPSVIEQQVSSLSSNVASSIWRSTDLPVFEQQVAEHTNFSSSSTSAAFQHTPLQTPLTNIGRISKEADFFSMNPFLELSNLNTSTVDWEGFGLENL